MDAKLARSNFDLFVWKWGCPCAACRHFGKAFIRDMSLVFPCSLTGRDVSTERAFGICQDAKHFALADAYAPFATEAIEKMMDSEK